MSDHAVERIRALPIWQGTPAISPLGGGRTNLNFTVTDDTGKYVARIGDDIPVHHVLRFNELAASKAAHAAGLSPKVIYAGDGLAVIDYIESKTFSPADVRAPENLERVVAMVKSCHTDIPQHFRGPSLIFWVSHLIRDYAAAMEENDSGYKSRACEFAEIGNKLERAVGPIDVVFGHNDLIAENILDDGKRLWLIDWDYAGFGSPLFDLGGLASNSGFSPAQENTMLEVYFDTPVTDELLHRYHAMKCASLLRETMWGMVSEVTSKLQDVDYAGYTAEYLVRFDAAYASYKQM